MEMAMTGPNDFTWWRDVVKEGGSAGDCWFSKDVRCVLGDGKSISFWKEKWDGEVPLMELFPNLFAMDCLKNAAVADRILANGPNQDWN
ncbi:putative ribonuclease H protein, partial [Trifolium medium]|nr:putative ribonuclease H protein [Trifolium medium]